MNKEAKIINKLEKHSLTNRIMRLVHGKRSIYQQ